MKANEEKQLVTQALEALASAIERGESEQLKAYLGTLARFHQYSLSNVFLIAVQRPNATRVAGFRTWQKVGRYVKKGDKPDGREGDDAEELVRLRSVCVFDVAQTEGRPLPELAQARGEPGKFTGRLKEFAAERGIHVEISGALVSAHGLSSGGKILVRKGLPAAEEFSVLAHELLHKAEEEQPSSRTVRETEAEAVAFVVCQAIGLEAINAAADYTHLYQGSKETLLESLQRIPQAAVQIIGAIMGRDEARGKASDTEWQAAGAGEHEVAHAA